MEGVTVMIVGGRVTTLVDAEVVIVMGGRVTVRVVGIWEIVVAGELMGAVVGVVVEEVRPRVPEMVTAPRVTEVPSATRFHFLKEAIGGPNSTVWTTRANSPPETRGKTGNCGGGEGEEGTTVPGTSTEPTIVTFAKLEYKVVAVVKTRTVVVLSTALDTTTVVVGTEVVTRALVMVATGKKPDPAGPEKTEILSPAGAEAVPLTVWTLNGLLPVATV
jgi:hypothetical protein